MYFLFRFGVSFATFKPNQVALLHVREHPHTIAVQVSINGRCLLVTGLYQGS